MASVVGIPCAAVRSIARSPPRPRPGGALDRQVSDAAEVAAAQGQLSGFLCSVELEVDFKLAVLAVEIAELGDEAVVASEADAVGIDERVADTAILENGIQ